MCITDDVENCQPKVKRDSDWLHDLSAGFGHFLLNMKGKTPTTIKEQHNSCIICIITGKNKL